MVLPILLNDADAITNGFEQAFSFASQDEYTRIMCWAHLWRIVESKTKSIGISLGEPTRDAIRLDIEYLQASYSEQLFNHLLSLFESKWKAKREKEIDAFLEYFRKEWIESKHSKWYEGAASDLPYFPTTDNGLESTNARIKGDYTLRNQMSVSQYLRNAVGMVRNWSLDRGTAEKQFQTTVKIPGSTWELAQQCISSQPVIKRLKQTDTFLLTEGKHEKLINSDLLNNKFEKLTGDFDYIISCIKSVKKITLSRANWSNSVCVL